MLNKFIFWIVLLSLVGGVSYAYWIPNDDIYGADFYSIFGFIDINASNISADYFYGSGKYLTDIAGGLWLNKSGYLYPNSTFGVNVYIPAGNLSVNDTLFVGSGSVNAYHVFNGTNAVSNGTKYIVYPFGNNTGSVGLTTNWFADGYFVNLHGDGSDLTGISAGKSANGFYLYNDTSIIYFNESMLNATIDARNGTAGGVSDIWVNETGDTMTGNLTINANLSAYYLFGQPLDGSIGSGIIWASSNKIKCGCLNITSGTGLNVSYPNLTARVWNMANTTTYCNITGATIEVPDNAHTVYYVDSDCSVNSAAWENYFSNNLNPSNYARIFDVYTHNGKIEIIKGSALIGLHDRKQKWNSINCGGTGHLSICKGIDIVEDVFPVINQTSGSYIYINSEHTSASRKSDVNGIHIVTHSGGEWTHINQSHMNLTHCDDGSDYVFCSNDKFRRYIIYTIGFGQDHTTMHQLAPLDSEYYNNLADCINLEKNPLSYTLPSSEKGVAVVHHLYCGSRDDTSWSGAWLDLRAGDGGYGATPDLSIFVLKAGDTMTGNLNMTWQNISDAYFYGNGTGLINILTSSLVGIINWINMPELSYTHFHSPANITGDFSVWNGLFNIAAENITSGTFGSGNFIFPNALDVNGELKVGGGFLNSGCTFDTGGNIWCDGSITFSGEINISNVNNLSINGSQNPRFDDTFDLGNLNHRWRNLYISNNISAIGNISAKYYFGSGKYLTGITAEANVTDTWVNESGDTMTGNLTVNANISTQNVVLADYLQLGEENPLPIASSNYRNKIVCVNGMTTDVSDKCYICLKSAGGVGQWSNLFDFETGTKGIFAVNFSQLWVPEGEAKVWNSTDGTNWEMSYDTGNPPPSACYSVGGNGSTILLGCYYRSGTTKQAKIYNSTDGGKTWTLDETKYAPYYIGYRILPTKWEGMYWLGFSGYAGAGDVFTRDDAGNYALSLDTASTHIVSLDVMWNGYLYALTRNGQLWEKQSSLSLWDNIWSGTGTKRHEEMDWNGTTAMIAGGSPPFAMYSNDGTLWYSISIPSWIASGYNEFTDVQWFDGAWYFATRADGDVLKYKDGEWSRDLNTNEMTMYGLEVYNNAIYAASGGSIDHGYVYRKMTGIERYNWIKIAEG